LDNADQKNDADKGDYAQLAAAEVERQEGAEARRGQGRDDSQRMDEVFIEHAEYNVNSDQRRHDEQWFSCGRLHEGPGVSGKIRMYRIWQVEICQRLADACASLLDANTGAKIVSNGDSRKLALVFDQERYRRFSKARQGR